MKKKACAIMVSPIIMILSLQIEYARAEEALVHISYLEKSIYKISYTLPYTFVHLASIGKDGTFLIDAGAENTAQELLCKIKKIGNGKITFILSTHAHQDHIGGNPVFAGEAPIFAHVNVRKRYSSTYYYLSPIEKKGEPTVTYKDTITLYMNGQTIIIQHVPSGHTDGDSIVYFPESKILYIGDLVIPDKFSTIDLELGGNAGGFLKNLEVLITQYPDETRYIPAHGREYTKDALRYYHNAFVETLTPIKKELGRGKTIQQIVESSIFNDYKDWLRKEDWVEVLQKQKSLKILPSVCEPLTQIIIEKDIDEALKTYKKIKMEAQDKFLFAENQLNTLGYQLLERKMTEEAISIFTLNTKEYPNSSNVYDSLGEAYRIQGNAECAEANFNKALQLDPNNVYAKEHLKQLHDKKN